MWNEIMLPAPIILPVLFGLGLAVMRPNRSVRQWYCMGAVLCNLCIVLLLVWNAPEEAVTLVRCSDQLSISFRLDGFGKIFACLVALLWPVTTCYAFEYMKHEGKETSFFAYFLCTFGIVIGIAFAGNLLTLYTFYELLTLVTLPLVMHGMGDKARHAGRQYLIYSMIGAALVFVALVIVLQYSESLDFQMGGVLDQRLVHENLPMLHAAFLLAFFGFGVKCAVFPFYRWLPGASVAPTPVTALLHAVAVVKAGAFAIGRTIFHIFGPDFLQESWMQQLALGITAFTIILASLLALRTPHLKRRLAYSTVANLSYILFAFSLMTPQGFLAGTLHMLVHGVGKITLFFCAGSVLYQTKREFVEELTGLGRRMPIVLSTFTLCSLALAGIPPFAGFSSKWLCISAAAELGGTMALWGIGALVLSSLLAALYLGDVILRSFDTSRDALMNAECASYKDPNRLMTVPLLGLAAACTVLAFAIQPLVVGLEALLLG